MDVELMQWMDQAGSHVAADVDAYGTAFLMCDENRTRSPSLRINGFGATKDLLNCAFP